MAAQKTAEQLAREAVTLALKSAEFETLGSAQRLQLQQALCRALEEDASPMLTTESREVTVLMADIRGFSLLAARYSSLRVVDLLNRYFQLMGAVVTQYQGSINKLLGDGMMVLFGLDGDADHAGRAVNCAVAMQCAMAELNAANEAEGLPEVYMGIGINTGEVVAGPMGPPSHCEHTVIGDSVNLAARIEAYALRGQVLISEATLQAAGDIEVGPENAVHIKGRREPIAMYEVRRGGGAERLAVPSREMRRSARVPTDIACSFQRLVGKNVLPEAHSAQVVDLSYDGFALVSELELAVGTQIKLPLVLQRVGSSVAEVYATVMSVEARDGDYRYGASITGMDDDAQMAIKRYVDEQIVGG